MQDQEHKLQQGKRGYEKQVKFAEQYTILCTFPVLYAEATGLNSETPKEINFGSQVFHMGRKK